MFPKKTVPLLPLLFFTLSSAPALADDPSAKIQTTPESGLLRGLADDLESRREQIETNSGLRKKKTPPRRRKAKTSPIWTTKI